MNLFQHVGFFISFAYTFYVLWFKFPEEYFFVTKYVFLSITIAITYACVGLAIDFDDQSSVFMVPLFLIANVRVVNLFSTVFFKRRIAPCHPRATGARLSDSSLTLVILFLTMLLPILLFNYLFNCHFFTPPFGH